ncbi:hypothetical protein CC80DRAFT_429338 [Byssothecium circinans]|uniref:Zinc finger C2H2 LYAR-type domain-containing protein n=1 Tax=Byssothecium circinans TaxID=147558 RepID=A0A6A5TAP0_9PLEO|nr:hypothetical protein CC80DRAFT_429338 [Byssothecium circinans]
MVSFSCENCGDVLTKKKLDGHRNQCYGASFTCLDCMQHFQGTSYKTHTSCISEDQKYQGKLYKDKKKPQHQKNDSAQQYNSQALVPHAYVEDAPDVDTVALVDAPPRAPTPPPAANSLGYEERAALPPVNVFDFLDTSQTPNPSRVHLPVDESRMIEDSIPPAYEEEPQRTLFDVMKFQVADDEDYARNGFAYGDEPIRPTNERFDSSYVTPAPKSKHNRTKSRDKDIDTTIRKEERKRKRNSPPELDMSLVRTQQERDVMMDDAPPMLHSGLTGGLNRLLARNEFPPSPEYSGGYENSPLSPMKRAKQGASKAFIRAQRQLDLHQEKERKAELKETKKDKERGRERERKERKASNALVKIRPKIKNRDDSAREGRKIREVRRRRQYSSSVSPARGSKPMKAIEYHPSRSHSPGADGNNQLIVRPNGDVVPVKTEHEARAELFMSFVNKGPDSERGMSINKTLKRYHRERSDSWDRGVSKADEEKELWKSIRLKRNDRGEIVLFFAPPEAA